MILVIQNKSLLAQYVQICASELKQVGSQGLGVPITTRGDEVRESEWTKWGQRHGAPGPEAMGMMVDILKEIWEAIEEDKATEDDEKRGEDEEGEEGNNNR